MHLNTAKCPENLLAGHLPENLLFLDQTGGLQRLLDLFLVRVTGFHQRQTAGACLPAQHVHGVLDRDGVEQSYSPEESLISEELFALYVKALDRLPERCREVFIRIREEKQSYTQVAEELGISMNTVDAQLQKAITRLKEMICRAEID